MQPPHKRQKDRWRRLKVIAVKDGDSTTESEEDQKDVGAKKDDTAETSNKAESSHKAETGDVSVSRKTGDESLVRQTTA